MLLSSETIDKQEVLEMLASVNARNSDFALAEMHSGEIYVCTFEKDIINLMRGIGMEEKNLSQTEIRHIKMDSKVKSYIGSKSLFPF